jgi:hypothetical protein
MAKEALPDEIIWEPFTSPAGIRNAGHGDGRTEIDGLG